MDVVTAKVPPEIAEWLDEESDRLEISRSSLIREISEETRAARDGGKVLVDPSTREIQRLVEYADREGLTREEAARELLKRALEEDRAVTDGDLLKLNPPVGVANSVVERAERENMGREEAAVRILEDGISSRTRVARAYNFMSTVVVFSAAALVGVVFLPEFTSIGPGDIPEILILTFLGAFIIGVGGALFAKIWQFAERAREANLFRSLSA